jgi:hypothetical protein
MHEWVIQEPFRNANLESDHDIVYQASVLLASSSKNADQRLFLFTEHGPPTFELKTCESELTLL